jgi:hypothetical protein
LQWLALRKLPSFIIFLIFEKHIATITQLPFERWHHTITLSSISVKQKVGLCIRTRPQKHQLPMFSMPMKIFPRFQQNKSPWRPLFSSHQAECFPGITTTTAWTLFKRAEAETNLAKL